ncbi:MAG: hypothetical protein A3C55_04045 [Gammaproteobacteria bacterium RIFCSPHIGHO2_02_FULL_42_13]|nr:MAG: hypothetical protein A3C55_04045 [Gammaproteobacteria bacterium RIFCSPHIGHO2_02_FULL_42_13]OGT69721.1 MAG: hypothetical protein A3H43_04105 [Gammaproteobacteria bacterium RIFCSPLOWO2_02_FULL_42_9]
MKAIKYMIVLLLILLGISFAILNSETVTINYYLGTKQMPLSLLLIVAFGLGLLIGWISMSFKVLRLKTNLYRLKKKLQVAEKEIDNLRAIPVKDER